MMTGVGLKKKKKKVDERTNIDSKAMNQNLPIP